jgi:hypothetical protein
MDSLLPNRIDLLAVMLVDLRATVDAEKRAVVSAQASAEEYRVGHDRHSLDDIADTLAQLTEHARMLTDGLKEASRVLRGVHRSASNPSESSSV